MEAKRVFAGATLVLGLVLGGGACTDDDGDTGETTPSVGGNGDDTLPIGDPESTETEPDAADLDE